MEVQAREAPKKGERKKRAATLESLVVSLHLDSYNLCCSALEDALPKEMTLVKYLRKYVVYILCSQDKDSQLIEAGSKRVTLSQLDTSHFPLDILCSVPISHGVPIL